MADLSTPAGRRATYVEYRETLEEVVTRSEQHRAAEPDCDARPMCIGGQNLLAIGKATSSDSGHPLLLVIVAVQELAEARRRLDVQRGISASLTAQIEMANERADCLRAQLDALS
jgi:hypothetical protein